VTAAPLPNGAATPAATGVAMPTAIAVAAGSAPVPIHPGFLPEPEPGAAPTSTPRRTCEVCGNDYDKAFEVLVAGTRHVFDCFECAIHALAPQCAHCGCRIVGHGMEHANEMFCCAHCAQARGVTDLKDRS
jgi:hypothetical protein